MTTFTTPQRFLATAAITLSLALTSGCRSAGNASNSDTSTYSYGSTPFYTPFPKPAKPYSEEMNQLPSQQPAPRSIQPVPGYNEPEVPPPPSAQRSRWNLTPSNFKLPALNRQKGDVNQTSARSDDNRHSASFKKPRTNKPTLRSEAASTTEEVVRPRLSGPHAFKSNSDDAQEAPSLSSPIAEKRLPPPLDNEPRLLNTDQ